MSYAIQSEINATVPQVLEIVIVVSPHTPVYLFFPFMFSIFEFGRSRLNKTDTSALRTHPPARPSSSALSPPAGPCMALSFRESRIDIVK